MVNNKEEFEELKSTRFYGPLVYYLTWHKDLDNIISHYLTEGNSDDLAIIGTLFYLIHPEALTFQQVKFNSDEQTTMKSIEVNILILFINLFLKLFSFHKILILNELKKNTKSELALKVLTKKTTEKSEIKN